MSDKTYDTLKFLALVVLPALGTLYFALSQIWGLPYGEQIVGTITAIDAFLGALLKIDSDRYYGVTGKGDGEDIEYEEAWDGEDDEWADVSDGDGDE